MSVDVDVLVVGAGLSGIGAACHLEERLPGTSYAVLEARETSGGTWDLFRYPGVRSDSDMYTLGYRFRPWTQAQSIADGESILRYVRETAEAYGVDRHIRYRQRVVSASWSSADARWTVTTASGDVFTCGFLWCCSGYYRYDAGYSPDFEGVDSFDGLVVHPQHWPGDLDVRGKRVVVVGSGATAVTLVPSLADAGAHVTMLQRSPTYVLSVPGIDPAAAWLRDHLPDRAASFLTRWKSVLVTSAFYQLSRRRPDYVRRLVRKGVASQLPDDFDVDTHFRPAYDPWDQRMCFVPDGDLFKAIRRGDVDVVTDHIDRFTQTGLRLASGRDVEADVVVTATGLQLLAFGGIALDVDGSDVHVPGTMSYQGMLLSGVPNFAYVVGYTNASWTLKADLVSEYVCRLLGFMRARGHDTVVPERDPSVAEEPFMDFSSGYVQRSLHLLPKQGSRAPWRLRMNYLRDLVTIRRGRLEHESLHFSRSRSRVAS
jgi:monooxygenase